MAGKEILFHDSARERIVTGANMLADAVKVTLGPRGRTVVIDRSFGAPSTSIWTARSPSRRAAKRARLPKRDSEATWSPAMPC